MIWVVHLQHRLSAQRCTDVINMWPNAVGIFKYTLAGVYVYKKFVRVLSGFIKMLIKKFFLNLKTLKNKIISCGIHYFITKLKTKIDVIPRSRFKWMLYWKRPLSHVYKKECRSHKSASTWISLSVRRYFLLALLYNFPKREPHIFHYHSTNIYQKKKTYIIASIKVYR